MYRAIAIPAACGRASVVPLVWIKDESLTGEGLALLAAILGALLAMGSWSDDIAVVTVRSVCGANPKSSRFQCHRQLAGIGSTLPRCLS